MLHPEGTGGRLQFRPAASRCTPIALAFNSRLALLRRGGSRTCAALAIDAAPAAVTAAAHARYTACGYDFRTAPSTVSLPRSDA